MQFQETAPKLLSWEIALTGRNYLNSTFWKRRHFGFDNPPWQVRKSYPTLMRILVIRYRPLSLSIVLRDLGGLFRDKENWDKKKASKKQVTFKNLYTQSDLEQKQWERCLIAENFCGFFHDPQKIYLYEKFRKNLLHSED